MGRPIAPSPTNPRRCTATTPSLSPAERGELRLHDLLHSPHDAVAEAFEVQLRRLRAEFLPQAPEVRRPKLGVDVELGYPQRDRAPQITLGEPGGAVQGEGDRARAPDLSQPPPVEFRDAGVVAVDVAHRYREAVHAALPGEPPGLALIGRLAAQGLARLVLLTLDPAKLGLDPDAAGSQRAHHGPGEGEILAEGELRAVGHHGVHPTVGGSLYQAPVPDVVELHEDVGRGAPSCGPEGPHEPLAAFRPEGRRAHEDYHRRPTGLGGPGEWFSSGRIQTGTSPGGKSGPATSALRAPSPFVATSLEVIPPFATTKDSGSARSTRRITSTRAPETGAPISKFVSPASPAVTSSRLV